MSTKTQDIPTDVKENLLELADRLPSAAQSQFLRNTTEKLRDLSLQYQNTLVYTAVGWVVGEIIDNVLTYLSRSGHLPAIDPQTWER